MEKLNPFEFVRIGTEFSMYDIKNFVAALIPTQDGHDEFWQVSARKVLEAICLYEAYAHQQSDTQATPYLNISEIVQSNKHESLCDILQNLDCCHDDESNLISETITMLQDGSHVFNAAVLRIAASALNKYNNPPKKGPGRPSGSGIKPTSERIMIYLPSSLATQLRALAKENGNTITGFVEDVIRERIASRSSGNLDEYSAKE